MSVSTLSVPSASETTIDIKGFLRDLVQFETEHDLFALRLRGRGFWDYLRYALFLESLEKLGSHECPSHVLAGSPIPDDFASAFLHLARTALSKPAACDLLLLNYSRTALMDGKEVNIHAYPVIKQLGSRVRILLVDRQPLSVDVESLYSCDVLRARPWHLIDRLRTVGQQFTAPERRLLTDVEDAFYRRFGVRHDMVRMAKTHFLFQLRRLAWYRRLLARTRPRVVMFCDDGHQKSLIEAAADEGIASVDLQHSLISALNVLYVYSDKLREPLPTMADHVFTYGEFWHQFYQLPSQLKAVGFPYFEQQREEALAKTRVARDRNILVVGMIYPKETTPRVALELARLLPDYTIYYKLRYEEYATWRERYPADFVAQPNLVVIDSNETPLYQWFARCSYQIGINSTAICEGMGFGLTTFILKVGWYQEMELFYQRGHMFLVDRAEEIAELIRSGAHAPSPLDVDALFKPNALANMQSAIADVIASNEKSIQ